MDNPTCTIEGCEKPARTKSAALCKMHYHRQYRSGSAGEASERKREHLNAECRIDGCAKPDKEVGLCAMHGARVRRHGDPHMVILPSERYAPSGPAHPHWAGVHVGYGAAHTRVERLHGSASNHSCVDCGRQAQHWSYNHDDPNELTTNDRGALPYSADPVHYSPRCGSCHKMFDLGRKHHISTAGG
jgi:hypothetical protein